MTASLRRCRDRLVVRLWWRTWTGRISEAAMKKTPMLAAALAALTALTGAAPAAAAETFRGHETECKLVSANVKQSKFKFMCEQMEGPDEPATFELTRTGFFLTLKVVK